MGPKSIKYTTVGRILGRLSFLPVILVVLATACLAGSIQFTSDNGLVMVPVWLDNRVQGRFGIDTGADKLYIDSAFAAENRIDFETDGRRYNVYGIDGISGAYETQLKWFELGDERLTDQPATIINLKRMSRSSQGIPDGLIGREILSQFYVTVDYQNQRLDLDKYRPQFVDGKRYREIRYTDHWHLILVDVRINDSIEVPMILDYGATITSISPALARRVGVEDDPGGVHQLGSLALDTESTVTGVLSLVVDYSDYREKVNKAQFEGILGATYLEHLKITVDYQRDLLYIRDN